MQSDTRLNLRTANTAVAQMLREEIDRGELQPGTRLLQSELARRFGVSTTPVREALASLQAEALVRIDAHRGAVVSTPTLEDMRECFEIRRVLEPHAAVFATRLPAEELDELEELVNAMRTVDDAHEWVELNDRFHNRLYAASGNERLQEIIESLRKSSRYFIHLYVANGLSTHSADDEHQEILDACRAGESARVRSLMRGHLERTLRGVTRFLDLDGGRQGRAGLRRRAHLIRESRLG